MGEASRAAAAAAAYLSPSHVIISTDAAADDNSDHHDNDNDIAAAAAAGVRVMLMPDDDDGAHAGGYGSNAPWKKAQSRFRTTKPLNYNRKPLMNIRFPHALAAAVAHMPPHVKWIVSQDSGVE